MRNCDARMTGEVHKRFYEQRRNWSVLSKPYLVLAAVAVCVAMYLGTAPTLRAAPQQNISGSNSERVSGPPVITAKPERVTLRDGSGRPRLNGIPETDRWVLFLSLKKTENRFLLQTVREVSSSLHGSENVAMSSNSMVTISGRRCSVR